MSRPGNLTAGDQAKIDAKLAELQEKTGESWACEITQQPCHTDCLCLLEIAVNGRVAKPVEVEYSLDDPAGRICREMDRLYEARLAKV